MGLRRGAKGVGISGCHCHCGGLSVQGLHEAQIGWISEPVAHLVSIQPGSTQSLADEPNEPSCAHGDLLGEHMLFNKAATLYVSEIRIPMMIRFPGGDHSGKAIEQFGSGIDVLPTLMDILKIDNDLALPGLSLLPAIAEDAQARKHVTTTIIDAMTIRTDTEKLWYNGPDHDGEMYDLADDPACTDLRGELFEAMLQSRMTDDRIYSQPTPKEVRLREEVSSSHEPET